LKKKKIALIVGGTGQLGITLSKILIKKNISTIITSRDPTKNNYINEYGVLLRKLNIYNKKEIRKILYDLKPNFIFYFASQSSPKKSFKKRGETMASNFLGCKNFLDIINLEHQKCKFINAASSEMYGKINGKITINTPKIPVNPYGKSKVKSFDLTSLYRSKYKLKTYNAVIFNTDSFYRNKNFLIPKICIAAINAKKFDMKTTFGNIKISREWNWADEQMEYLYKFIQKKPQDFILSNGKNYKISEMMNFAFNYLKIDYKKYILSNEKFSQKNEIIEKKSNFKNCLKRNRIKRTSTVFGKKLTIKLINFILNNKKFYNLQN